MVAFSELSVPIVAFVYLLFVLGIGYYASRVTSMEREDYLMADRSFGTIVLFFVLFATNMTAILIIGGPALAYGGGIAGYGFFVGFTTLTLPVIFMTVGYRIWIIGKKFGHITPGQILNHRLDAKYLGVLTTFIFAVWTIPFIMVGAQGGGVAFNGLTNGLISYELGALLVILVVIGYVSLGGQRGTGWTNVVQGIVFLLFLLVTAIWVPLEIGGVSEATNAVAQASEAHLMRGDNPQFQPRPWFSIGLLLTLGVIMYPHMFVRFMTARSQKAIKNTSLLYPFALIIAWIPATLIGFWGVGQLQELPNPDMVFPAMVAEFLPLWVMGLALAGILAAVMSSIDGQVLTLSTLFSENIVREFFDFDETKEVWSTRVFIFLLLALAYASALTTQETIIQNALFFISGYAATFVPIVSAIYLERVNKEAVTAGLVLGFASMWAFNFGWVPQNITFGFLPIIPVLVAQIIVMSVIVLLIPSLPDERTEEYRRLFEDFW